MQDDSITLSNFEKNLMKKLNAIKISTPKNLDKIILDDFDKNRRNYSNSTFLQEGYFSLMVASDDEVTVAVDMFDDEMKVKLRVFEAHDGSSPYLVEIHPLEGYEDLFEKYQGATIIIKADNKEVLRSQLTDNDFSGFIPRDRVNRKRCSWSYHIFICSSDTIGSKSEISE